MVVGCAPDAMAEPGRDDAVWVFLGRYARRNIDNEIVSTSDRAIPAKFACLCTRSARSLTRRLALSGLVTAIALLPSGHISHGIQQIEWNGSASCLDVPVSSQIIHPTRCWMSGPTSIVVAGTDPRSGKSMEMVSHPRSGPLHNSKL